MLKASRFLDPKSDVVFKKIFTNHADILMSFLNGVLPLSQPIRKLEYLSPEQSPIIPELKRPIVDVKCEDALGRIFIVEMQMAWSQAFSKRILYSVSQAYVQQLDRGKMYQELCPVYGLALLNQSWDDSPEWYHHYRMQHTKNADKQLEGLEIILLELPKFQPRNWEERRLGVLWLRFLRETRDWVEIPEEFQSEPAIVKACELAQESGYNRAELDAYNRYWDSVRTELTLFTDWKIQGFEEGKAEGMAAGIAVGKAEGMAVGKAEGLVEGKIEIAKALLFEGFDTTFVAKTTGLSLEEVKLLASTPVSK